MLSDHKARPSGSRGRAAKAERHTEASRLVADLTVHAQTEEQVS